MWQVSLRGTLGGATPAESTEIWSFGTWWNTVSNTVPARPAQDIVDDWAPLALGCGQTFLADTDAGFCDNVFITEARVYWYAGTIPAGATNIGYAEATGVHAGTQATHVPFQNTLVVTLDTTGRSKPRSGRFYLPPMSALPDASGLLTAGKVAQIGGAVQAFLHSMDTQAAIASSQDMELVVASRGTSITQYKPIRGLRIGHVMDTQRRRRNAENEDYTAFAYP